MSQGYSSILVGGIATSFDLVPSIVFVILYSLVLCVYICRLVDPQSRQWLNIRTTTAVVERIVVLSLRVAVSNAPGTESEALSEYFQWTIASAPLLICEDLTFILRSILVQGTRTEPHPSSEHDLKEIPMTPSDSTSAASTSPSLSSHKMEQSAPSLTSHTTEQSLDLQAKKRRQRYRGVHTISAVSLSLALAFGITGAALFIFQRQNQKISVMSHVFRYISTVIVFLSLLCLSCTCLWVKRRFPNLNPRTVSIILYLCTILLISSSYRLWALSHTTLPDIMLTPSAPLASPSDKTVFWIINIVPEFIVSAFIIGVNAKETFGVGMYGDSKPLPCCASRKKCKVKAVVSEPRRGWLSRSRSAV